MMRVLVLYAHPVETSFCAALHEAVVKALRGAGHEVDDCDLHAEGFDPVLSRGERLAYHDVPGNVDGVAAYVARLRAADALVIVCPVWNFGFPAILKGFLDRVFLPGVSFSLDNGRARGELRNIGRVVMVTSYGGSRLRAMLMGDPPRRVVKRMIRSAIRPFARVRYLAHYDMNNSTLATRSAFLDKVAREMRAI
jgi:putative NADPH-quinone reductase